MNRDLRGVPLPIAGWKIFFLWMDVALAIEIRVIYPKQLLKMAIEIVDLPFGNSR